MSAKLLLIAAILLSPFYTYAQFSWDGGAGTTDWQDANNWNPDVVPTTGSLVQIGLDVTITGFAINSPARIQINGGADVTLDLSMIVGDGVSLEHGFVIGANSSLTIAAGNAIFVDVPTTQRAVSIGTGANNAVFNVESTASLILQQSQFGINVANATAAVNNAGNITITSPASDGVRIVNGTFTNTGTISVIEPGSDGIENSANFINNGTIEVEDADRYGIFNNTAGAFDNSGAITITNPGKLTNDGIRTRGDFDNNAAGMITISNAEDDAIDVQTGSFTNDGAIDVTVRDVMPAAANNGISVGTASDMATFTNSATGTIQADGGASTIGRGIFVFDMGELENEGEITFEGGNDGSRLYSRGEVHNKAGGELDMTDGRININMGSLINDGLIISTRGTPGVTNAATATNNGFFDYTGSGNFANGAGATTDNGIDVNNAGQTSINAGGSCTVDIAEVAYEYFDNGNSVGSTDASGSITFMNVLSSDPVTLTNELGVSIQITNVCAQAILPIELTYFQAIPSDKQVLLKWQTSTEVNNDYMEVERSTDSRSFRSIGRVDGAGNSDQLIDYQLTDPNPLSGISYYRLRQVDFDGSVNFSKIVTVQFRADGTIPKVYPTLLQQSRLLTVDLQQRSSEPVLLELVNLNGQQVKRYTLQGGAVHQIDTNGIEKGTYILRSNEADGSWQARIMIF
jgi:hypothetical protein